MVSKAGAPLLKPEAVETLRRRLLPLARVVTPNIPEAEILSGQRIDGPEALRRAAREIRRLGPESVVVKGGHGQGDPVDLFFDGKSFTEFRGPRIRTRSDHGTGCTFSAAIAALLARGEEVKKAVEEAKRYVEGAIRSASPIGSGHGPLNHFFRFTTKD
jgi:hydroxymethylpyrimidine/phosphomethylpyrimidine kinase